jgi:dTDP-4-dehydrorhamnose reductase
MKILIVGSTGMLGNTFKKYLESLTINFETLDRTSIELSSCSKEELDKYTLSSECQYLINCAGLIKQRKGVTTEDFISVNSLLPHRLSAICQKYNIKMIHVTTDCVFDGTSGNYNEESTHNCNDIYGKSKSFGEPDNCTVIRTSIIGEEQKNKLSLLEWLKSNKNGNINGFKNHYWNGLASLQLSKVILNIINNDSFWKGGRNIFSNTVTKYDLVKMINEIYQLNININPVNDEASINRTLCSIYNNDEFNIPNLYKQIQETKLFHDNLRNDYLEKYYTN